MYIYISSIIICHMNLVYVYLLSYNIHHDLYSIYTQEVKLIKMIVIKKTFCLKLIDMIVIKKSFCFVAKSYQQGAFIAMYSKYH